MCHFRKEHSFPFSRSTNVGHESCQGSHCIFALSTFLMWTPNCSLQSNPTPRQVRFFSHFTSKPSTSRLGWKKCLYQNNLCFFSHHLKIIFLQPMLDSIQTFICSSANPTIIVLFDSTIFIKLSYIAFHTEMVQCALVEFHMSFPLELKSLLLCR